MIIGTIALCAQCVKFNDSRKRFCINLSRLAGSLLRHQSRRLPDKRRRQAISYIRRAGERWRRRGMAGESRCTCRSGSPTQTKRALLSAQAHRNFPGPPPPVATVGPLDPRSRRSRKLPEPPHYVGALQESDVTVVRPGMVHRSVLPANQGRGAQPRDVCKLGLSHSVARPDPPQAGRRKHAEVLADSLQLDLFGLPIEKLEAARRTSTDGKVHGQVSRCFAGAVTKRVTVLDGFDRLCSASRTGPRLLADNLKSFNHTCPRHCRYPHFRSDS